jgi:hypothetical protein
MYLTLIYKYLGFVRLSKYLFAIVVLRLIAALLLYSVFKQTHLTPEIRNVLDPVVNVGSSCVTAGCATRKEGS